MKQIQSNESLQHNNAINYQQAYSVKELIFQEIWGNESVCFAQFPDYIARLKSADLNNRAWLAIASDNKFNVVLFAPAGSLSLFPVCGELGRCLAVRPRIVLSEMSGTCWTTAADDLRQ